MLNSNILREAWEQYHGEPIKDDLSEPYYPQTPPIFVKAFVDGYEAAKAAYSSADKVSAQCSWRYDDLDDYWESSCGMTWCFSEGDLERNQHHYCPKCGKSISQA